MGLTPGTRLGPYQIQAAIGAGGMGEVYKARDTRLDRSVAIKVLPPDVSADPDRRARFEREAKTIAGLNHPHICTLHDVGRDVPTDQAGRRQAEGGPADAPRASAVDYLVMELLAGETLAVRLEKGALPLEQALSVATEIADALAAAHRQGIVHRDLKPANVMLTKSGAKLLDFGLAKLSGHGELPAAASLASAPTQTRPLTSEGTIVGTLQYMAPEQVEGKPADARADLWALGAILYEMLTGKRAFEGPSAASLIAAILEHDPAPIPTLRPLTPATVDRLVRQCLAKAPEDRPDTAHDVANDLRWLREASGVGGLTTVQARRRRRPWLVFMVAGVLAVVMIGAGVMWRLRPAAPRPSVARLSLDVRPAGTLNAGGPTSTSLPTPGGQRTALAWTPDGQALVFVGRRDDVEQLYLRRLDADLARPLPGTEGAQVPAISADGQAVAFWAGGTIRKVPLGGGPLTDIASGLATPPGGLAWDAAGHVYFGGGGGRIWQASPGGGPVAVTTVGDGELSHVLPWPLPGGKTLLYTVRKREWTWGDEQIVAQTLATGARKVLLRDAADARYVATGHLVFLRRGQLWAVPFDDGRVELRGTPVAVLDGVAQALTAGNSANITGAGQFAIAPTGTLAWVPGPVGKDPDSALVTVDRRGHVSPLAGDERSYGPGLRLSPDGRRLAVTIKTLTEVGLWVYDLARGMLTPVMQDGEVEWPRWSPDGQRLLFSWIKDGRESLATLPVDGSAPPQVLVSGDFLPSSFTRNGRQIIGTDSERGDLAVAAIEAGRAAVQPLTQTPQAERWPELSPDNHWLAYASNVTGRSEIWVRRYPGSEPGERVSSDGGQSSAWLQKSSELIYLNSRGPAGKPRVIALGFEAGSPASIGKPRQLFEFDPLTLRFFCQPLRCYDVSPDGQLFYVVQRLAAPPTPAVTHISLIQNWFEEVKAKVPIK